MVEILEKINNDTPTMCKNNSRKSAYSSGFSPLKNCNGLISLKPANGYYSYTQRCKAF